MKMSVSAILCFVLLTTSPANALDKPNILFIMADDVGIDAIGCYGGTSYKTPNIDALARDGMRFRHCYSMAVCHPTRITLLTGRYPFQLGGSKWGSFPKSEEKNTFASMLQRNGYKTAVAGKWQLILMKRNPRHPHQLGFDHYSVFGWHEGGRYWDPMIYQDGKVRDDTKGKYGPDLYTEFLIDFMQRNQDKPFLAYYSMALAHDVTDDIKGHVAFMPGKDRWENYGEMVESMDRQVGRLVAALESMKLRKKTLIIFTGDNGTPNSSYITVNKKGKQTKHEVWSMFNGRKVRGGKGKLDDSGTRVPLIAALPGAVNPGQVVDDLVDFTDFMPTIAELTDAKLPKDVSIAGKSFAATLRGETSDSHRTWAFAEHRGKYWVRTRKYKLYGTGEFVEVRPFAKEITAPDSKESRIARKFLANAMASLGYGK